MSKFKGTIVVDTERCKGCNLCAIACPQDLIQLSHMVNRCGYNYATQINSQQCNGCSSCGIICPDACITVILSDSRITSPILNSFDTAIVLNQPSLQRFEKCIKPGGTLIYDPASILNPPTRTDINIYSIEAMSEAVHMQNSKVFNMLLLGGLIKVRPILSTDDVVKGLHKTLPPRYHHLIPMNEKAIRHGMEIIKTEHIVAHSSPTFAH